ncbi:MAG: hypothetical protein IPM02_25655 [Betaproteobacteria bacterium]|nr:hypothetical protein [Betaproteobacteria bacterium]
MVRETLYVLLVLLHLLLEATVIAPDAGSAAVLLVFAYWTAVYCIEHLMLRRGPALLLRRSLWAVMFPVFTLPVGAYLFLKGALDTELNPDIVHAVMQTTPAEVLEFSTQYFLVQFICTSLAGLRRCSHHSVAQAETGPGFPADGIAVPGVGVRRRDCVASCRKIQSASDDRRCFASVSG